MMTRNKISYHRYALGAVDEEGSSDSRASSCNHHMHEISSLNYFQGSVGEVKVTMGAGEVRQLTKKLSSLVEEAKFLKQAFVESMEERKKLMDEIHEQLQIIRCSLSLKNQVKGEESCGGALLINPLKIKRGPAKHKLSGFQHWALENSKQPKKEVLQNMINKLGMMMYHSISKSNGNGFSYFHVSLSSPRFSIHKKQPKSQTFTRPPSFKQQSLKITTHHQQIKDMEVEVKLRLPDSLSHQKLSGFLSPFHTKTHLQENIFFDGANSELTSNLTVLRLRFYDLDSQCIVSLKAKPVISSGISRVEEDEEPIDPSIGRACVAEPWRLLSVNSSRIVKRVREEFGIGEKGLVCLGGFRNVRAVYDWNGLKLELDETHYDFGTSYELECESLEAEKTKILLEELLKENGITYSSSEVSKFAIFRSGKLPY